MLFRGSVRASMHRTQRLLNNGNDIMFPHETLHQKALRYLDITSFLTHMKSRRAHLLREMPEWRKLDMSQCEFERRWTVFNAISMAVTLPLACYEYYLGAQHGWIVSPKPRFEEHPFHMIHPKSDSKWSYDVVVQTECAMCRMPDLHCKKLCYDRLRDLGMDVWGLQRPKDQEGGDPFWRVI